MSRTHLLAFERILLINSVPLTVLRHVYCSRNLSPSMFFLFDFFQTDNFRPLHHVVRAHCNKIKFTEKLQAIGSV